MAEAYSDARSAPSAPKMPRRLPRCCPANRLPFNIQRSKMERNNTPVDYKRSPENDSEEAPPPKRQRNKAMRSCEACNRRKVKCDRNDPCTTCTRMGLECFYRDRNYRPQAKPTQLKDVLRSMERLEGMMQQVLQKDSHVRAPVEGKIDMRQVLPSEKSSRTLPKGKSTWDILLNPDDVDPVQAESVRLHLRLHQILLGANRNNRPPHQKVRPTPQH